MSEKKSKQNRNIFCAQPWRGVQITPDLQVKPCCMFEENFGSLKEGDLLSAFQSPLAQQVRNDFLQGRWAKNCFPCREEEELTGESPRTMSPGTVRDPKPEIGELNFAKAEVFLSNSCNLDCVMCSPEFSSRWNKHADFFQSFSTRFEKKKISNMTAESLATMLDAAENCEEFLVLGGEPLLSPHMETILKTWQEREYPGIVRVITNGTKLNDSLLNLMVNCNKLKMTVSVDGYGSLYEWIRGGAWSEVEKNLQTLQQNGVSFTISATVGAYNASGLLSLDRFCANHGYSLRVGHLVRQPRFLSVEALSSEEKRLCIEGVKMLVAEEKDILIRALNRPESEDLSDLKAQFDSWRRYFENERRLTLSEALDVDFTEQA